MLLINSDTVYIASTAREVFLPYLCRNGSGGTTMTQIALDMLTTGEGGQQSICHTSLLAKRPAGGYGRLQLLEPEP